MAGPGLGAVASPRQLTPSQHAQAKYRRTDVTPQALAIGLNAADPPPLVAAAGAASPSTLSCIYAQPKQTRRLRNTRHLRGEFSGVPISVL